MRLKTLLLAISNLLGVAACMQLCSAYGDMLYVSNGSPGTIERFNSNGMPSSFFGGLGYAAGSAFDGNGNLFAADFFNGTVAKITPTGAGSVFASGFSSPSGIAFDSGGNLFVADTNANQIDKVTPGGVTSIFATSLLNEPVGLAFDTAGNLFAANRNNNSIVEFNSAGAGSVFANANLSAPYGLAFDPAGNLFAANFGNSTISKFTPSGAGSLFANSGLNAPIGLAFDSQGNLYAVNRGSIEKFTPTGIPSVFATSGLNDPGFVTSQVPEPSALILAVVAALGGAAVIHRLSRASDKRKRARAHTPHLTCLRAGTGNLLIHFEPLEERAVLTAVVQGPFQVSNPSDDSNSLQNMSSTIAFTDSAGNSRVISVFNDGPGMTFQVPEPSRVE